jgi:hypothetical protein
MKTQSNKSDASPFEEEMIKKMLKDYLALTREEVLEMLRES